MNHDLFTAAMTEDKTNPILPVRPLPRPAPDAQGRVGAEPAAEPDAAGLTIRNLTVSFGANRALKHISLDIPARAVTAIIGPSGCGKSVFLRALNRMHDLVPSARVEGQVRLFGTDIYGPGVEPALIRRRVGMVFQKSNPFPTMSVADNVTVGLRLNGVRDRAVLAERLHQSLAMAILWDEVKDRLDAPAISLSGGPATAPLHCARPGRAAGGPADGRAGFGAGPAGHGAHRGAHPRR